MIGDKIQELRDDAKSIGIRLDFGFNNSYVTLYHGTSKKSAEEIKKSGFFRDGFFFSRKGKQQYGDSVESYSKMRGERDGSGGEVIKMDIDVNSFHINVGTSEIESDGDLWIWNDNIWRNKEEKNEEKFEIKSSKKIAEELSISSIEFLMNFAISMLRYKYYSLKMTDKEELFIEFKEELNTFLDRCISNKRYCNKEAKSFSCKDCNEFIENINKLLALKDIEPLIEYGVSEKMITSFENFRYKF